MAARFADALAEAGEDQVSEACRSLGLCRDQVASVLATHRHKPQLLDLVMVMGGSLVDYVRTLVEIRDVDSGRWRPGRSCL